MQGLCAAPQLIHFLDKAVSASFLLPLRLIGFPLQPEDLSNG